MGFSSVIGASSVIRPGVCTSTTRPSSPYDGQVIYETDTDATKVWNGSSWVDLFTVPSATWTAFTPTWTNLTVGNGTVNAAYTTFGKTCTFYVSFALGSSSSIGDASMNFPVAPRDIHAARCMAFSGSVEDAGTRVYPILLSGWSTDTTKFKFYLGGTNNGISGILYFAATNSITFGSGDNLYIGGTYGIA